MGELLVRDLISRTLPSDATADADTALPSGAFIK
jgi:hypothetical protein